MSSSMGKLTSGSKIRHLRTQQYISLTTLAMKAGISTAQLTQLEMSPNPNPTINVALRLAKELGTTVEELFFTILANRST